MNNDNIQKITYEGNISKDYTKNSVFGISDKRIIIMKNFLVKNMKKDFKVLDLGCADGEIYKNYTKNMEFYGVDISKKLLQKAKMNGYKTFNLDIEKDSLPFSDDFFDIIITGETIEHIVNTDFFMTEINRVLKSNGKMIISIPNINQPISLFMYFLDLPPRYSSRFRSPHVRDFTFKTMKYCLRSFGFKIKNFEGTGLFIPFLFKSLYFFNKSFPRFSNEIVFLVEKEKDVKYDKKKVVDFNLNYN